MANRANGNNSGTISAYINRFRQSPPRPPSERQRDIVTGALPDFWWQNGDDGHYGGGSVASYVDTGHAEARDYGVSTVGIIEDSAPMRSSSIMRSSALVPSGVGKVTDDTTAGILARAVAVIQASRKMFEEGVLALPQSGYRSERPPASNTPTEQSELFDSASDRESRQGYADGAESVRSGTSAVTGTRIDASTPDTYRKGSIVTVDTKPQITTLAPITSSVGISTSTSTTSLMPMVSLPDVRQQVEMDLQHLYVDPTSLQIEDPAVTIARLRKRLAIFDKEAAPAVAPYAPAYAEMLRMDDHQTTVHKTTDVLPVRSSTSANLLQLTDANTLFFTGNDVMQELSTGISSSQGSPTRGGEQCTSAELSPQAATGHIAHETAAAVNKRDAVEAVKHGGSPLRMDASYERNDEDVTGMKTVADLPSLKPEPTQMSPIIDRTQGNRLHHSNAQLLGMRESADTSFSFMWDVSDDEDGEGRTRLRAGAPATSPTHTDRAAPSQSPLRKGTANSAEPIPVDVATMTDQSSLLVHDPADRLSFAPQKSAVASAPGSSPPLLLTESSNAHDYRSNEPAVGLIQPRLPDNAPLTMLLAAFELLLRRPEQAALPLAAASAQAIRNDCTLQKGQEPPKSTESTPVGRKSKKPRRQDRIPIVHVPPLPDVLLHPEDAFSD